jgi:hypothetical protein
MNNNVTTAVNDDPEKNMALVAKDGGDGTVEKSELQKFKDEAEAIARGAAWNVNERRILAEEIRYNLWEGQSRDGRKHANAQDGKPAFPFEGASDARIRLADMIVNERVLILTAAAFRNLPRVKGLELQNEALGHQLTTLLKWVLKNKLGGQYFREIVKLAQYQEADSPAAAILGVWWEQETALEMRTLTLAEIAQSVQALGLQPEQITALEAQMNDPEQDGETAQALQQLIPHLSDARAKKVVQELRENQEAEFPAPYLKTDQPSVCAYKLYEDIFLPTNTADPQKCRAYFVREWLGEWELRERQISYGYSEEFVTEVLKHEAATMFPLYRRNPGMGEFTIVAEEQTASKEARRGLYEVVTVVWKAVNEDQIPGIYMLPISGSVDFPAKDRELCDYKHGNYMFTFFAREILGSRLLDSRGVPELISTEQQALKLLADSFQDHVQLATLPNIKVPRRRSKLSLVIGPLKIIKEDRPGDVTYMQPPEYPQGNERQQEEVRRRVDEYWGRISENVAPMLTQLHQTGIALNFLTNLTDALTQVLQLCQQYISDEELQMICGDDGIPIARSREEIQGKFAVELTFDPRDLDMDYLKNIVAMIVQILQVDTLNTIQRDKLVQRLFSAIDPNLAAATIRPVEDANQSEVQDEQNNFAKISAGVEPGMVEGGQNFPLRLQTLTDIVQKNPEAYQKLSPVSKEIFDARVKYLQNQQQQIKNAQIGRQVGQPALGEESTGPGGPQSAPGLMGMMGRN